MTTEINSYDAREVASLVGEIIGCGDAREDGGWDFVVDTGEDEVLVSVVRDEATGLLTYAVI